MTRRQHERGAALLSVLLLVAMMAVIAAIALDRLLLAARLAGSSAAVDQGHAYARAAEFLALRRVGDIVSSQRGDWQGRDFPLALPGGSAVARLTDGGNCFNLNALAADAGNGRFSQRPLAVLQFAALARIVGIPETETAPIAAATADWIDSDTIESPLGAEDAAYRGLSPAYLPANTLMADATELRAVRGVSAGHFARLRPFICALPAAETIQINVNTLSAARAPLLAMLWADRITPAQARAALAARPISGYSSSSMFWQSAALRDVDPPADIAQQVIVAPRWIEMETMVRLGDSDLTVRATIDARRDRADARPAVVRRSWGHLD